MNRLSIVILTSNQLELTKGCLEALEDLSRIPGYEIILVDNGSTDGTPGVIPGLFPWVKFIPLPENIGVARGRNIGVGSATADVIMLLDNDTLPATGAILALEDYLRSNPDCGVVAPRLVDADGHTQQSFKEFPGLFLKMRNWLFSRKDSGNDIDTDKELEPFYVIGAAQMFRKEDFLRAGGLDENIFFGPEDADFCMAVRRNGKRIVYYPAVFIIHYWQRSTSGRKFSRRAWLHIKALLYFYRKHRRFI